MRLDTRRKLAYKPRIVRERQQYILVGVLQILKHNESNAVQEFVKLIRSEAPPQEIAQCLKHNLHHLQGRGLIPDLDIDETDLVSLGLQSLFSHRAGRNGARTTNDTASPKSSDRNDLRKSFAGTLHTNFDDSLHQRDYAARVADEFRQSLAYTNIDSSFDAEEQFLRRLDGDSLSDCSTDIAHSHGSAKSLSPPTPWSASTFGGFAGAVLASNARPLLQNTGLQHPGHWRISPTSLHQTTLPQHVLQQTDNTIPDYRMYDTRASVNEMCKNFKDPTQTLFGTAVQTRQTSSQGKTDRNLLSREHVPQDLWNTSTWMCEVSPTMT